MKVETFIIDKDKLEAFKKSCKDVVGIDFIDELEVDNKTSVQISYKYSSALFYLGRHFELQMQIDKYHA